MWPYLYYSKSCKKLKKIKKIVHKKSVFLGINKCMLIINLLGGNHFIIPSTNYVIVVQLLIANSSRGSSSVASFWEGQQTVLMESIGQIEYVTLSASSATSGSSLILFS